MRSAVLTLGLLLAACPSASTSEADGFAASTRLVEGYVGCIISTASAALIACINGPVPVASGGKTLVKAVAGRNQAAFLFDDGSIPGVPPGHYEDLQGSGAAYCGLTSDTGHIRCSGEEKAPGDGGWDALDIALGGGCAIRQGAMSCWGKFEPRVLNGSDFDEVVVGGNAVGDAWVCARRERGRVACDRSYPSPPSQERLHGLAAQVTGGTGTTTCGLRDDGSLLCWDASGAPDNPVVAVPQGSFVEITLPSDGFACALGTDGALTCWGSEPFPAGEPAGYLESWSAPLDADGDGTL